MNDLDLSWPEPADGPGGAGRFRFLIRDRAGQFTSAFERLIWYKAPDAGSTVERMAIDGTLTDFALTLERYLDGIQMAHLLTSADSLAGFLPRLTGLMERYRPLLVIDNAESLLTESGEWRDDRWGRVLSALTAGRAQVLAAGPAYDCRYHPEICTRAAFRG
jgi:hypothetical protein